MLARVRAAIAVVLRQQGYVSVVDVLVEMKRLTPAHLERLKAELLERGYNWRAGSASTLPTP